MPKVSKGVGLGSLVIDPRSTVPLYRQLYASVRGAILGGSLKPGTRLLSTRSMALVSAEPEWARSAAGSAKSGPTNARTFMAGSSRVQ